MCDIDLKTLLEESVQELRFSESIKNDWYRHSELVIKYGYRYAEALNNERKAEEYAKGVARSLFMKAKIGQAESVCGSIKPSDSVCDNYAKSRKIYKEAQAAWVAAKGVSEALLQIVYSINARKDALFNISAAIKQEYYTETEFEGVPDGRGLGDYKSILSDSNDDSCDVLDRMRSKVPRR